VVGKVDAVEVDGKAEVGVSLFNGHDFTLEDEEGRRCRMIRITCNDGTLCHIEA
jgi:hypothetical protein